jgi:PAS domain S-box-containing protein
LLLASIPVLLSIFAVRVALGTALTETSNLTLIALTAAVLVSALILRSGRIDLSGFVLVLALWAAGTFLTWMYSGFRDVAAILPLLAVLVAFLVLPWYAGTLLAAVSIGSVWLLVALGLRGLRRLDVSNPVDIGFIFTAVFILDGLVAFVSGQILRYAVRKTIATQQSLSESEKELSSILKKTPDIIYRLNPEGRIAYVNDAVRRYGYDPAKMVGTYLLDYVHPEDRDLARHRVDERRTGDRRTKALEIRLRTRLGEEKVAEYIAMPVFREIVFLLDAEGLYENGTGPKRYVGTQGIARDITDRKRAEEALKKSEEKYAKVFRAAPAGVSVASLFEARFLDVNEEFKRFMGFERDELIGRSAFDIAAWVNPEERAHIVDLLRGGEPVRDLEVHLRVKSGDVRTVRYNGQQIDIEGTACLLSAFEDITDRKRAEEALKKSEEKYATVFHSSPAGICIATLDEARYVDVNEECERLSGYKREELIGRSAFELGTWANPGEREHIIDLLRENKPARDLEIRYRTRNRDLLTVRYNGQLIDIGGTPCLLSAIEDITERKRLESQLQQAQKLEAVGRLAGGIAHDFNNMLAVIMGQAEMASSALESTDSIFESIQEIRKAAERSAELTRQLLTFAREQNVAPQVLDLNQVISERLTMLRRLMGENVILKWDPSPGLWPVGMDPAHVDQILLNLSANARDAILDIGMLTISTENRLRQGGRPEQAGGESPGEWVLLTVTDTGMGMSEESLAHLFEPFFTTKEVGKGTGLGLATVYGIVQRSRGWIEVESELGQGTTFRIYLPRAQGAVIGGQEADRTPLARGRETLLVVEDEPAILKILRTTLQGLGYTVMEAASVKDALAVAARHEGPVHLLLTDVIMPEMNGRDLYTKIAALHPGIRVIFMSGYTADVFEQPDGGKEHFSFLQKPFSMRQLSAKVREVLNGNKNERKQSQTG